jgi:hypothetical protein
LITQKAKAKPEQSLANKAFKEMFGRTRLWDEEKMALRNQFMQAELDKKNAEELEKQKKKVQKVRKKE